MSNRTKILIIEDNPGDVLLVSEALLHKGIEAEIQHVETASAAIAAVQGIHANSPSIPELILLDYSLPGGTAPDVLLAIQRNPVLAGVPRAVLTCSVAPKDRERALSAGADVFVYKPADLDEFLESVGSAVLNMLAQRQHLLPE
ncbi:MAG TPA: response regulator [Bryobacteraceae bacterium]|jgi:CheY-like chemotaxis protein|nr:response regulator [Bryobacteraceae bacterium]